MAGGPFKNCNEELREVGRHNVVLRSLVRRADERHVITFGLLNHGFLDLLDDRKQLRAEDHSSSRFTSLAKFLRNAGSYKAHCSLSRVLTGDICLTPPLSNFPHLMCVIIVISDQNCVAEFVSQNKTWRQPFGCSHRKVESRDGDWALQIRGAACGRAILL